MYVIILIIIILFTFLIIFSYIKNKNKFINTPNKKIAFLFLITDIINKEDLWYNFFKDIDTNKYSIYIHYKTSDKLKYFNEFKINNIIPTKWGDISLVQAEQILLQYALKDETNYKFIFVSGSCIPIKNFNYVYDFLINDNNSYFNNLIKINKNNMMMYKTFQWCILNKDHAKLIAYDTEEIKKYINVFASDELYILTTLKKYNDKNIVINMTPNIYTTYANWGNGWLLYNDDFINDYKKFNSSIEKKNIFFNKYPYNYIKVDDAELKYLVNDTKCLFMRKITKDCVLNENLLPY